MVHGFSGGLVIAFKEVSVQLQGCPDIAMTESCLGLTKHFGAIAACIDVGAEFRSGELTAIVGDNGAGKSTLVKMLTGALQPETGTIELRGQPVQFSDPLDARIKGVETVYQELALSPNLDVVSNIFLGRELTRTVLGVPFLRRLDEGRMTDLARTEIQRLKINIPKLRGLTVARMSGGQRQSVAIARSVYWATSVLVLDEPTAALGVRESRAVLDLVKRILAENISVIMVSHILPHVIELADHLIVMRHGHKVADVRDRSLQMEDIVKLIVGGP